MINGLSLECRTKCFKNSTGTGKPHRETPIKIVRVVPFQTKQGIVSRVNRNYTEADFTSVFAIKKPFSNRLSNFTASPTDAYLTVEQ